jgi:hypothetical protein
LRYEVGSWKLEVGSWKLEVGSWKKKNKDVILSQIEGIGKKVFNALRYY